MARDWDVRADELSAEALARGEPTAWFDRLYAEGAAGTVSIPWSRDEPQRHLLQWAERAGVAGAGLAGACPAPGLAGGEYRRAG